MIALAELAAVKNVLARRQSIIDRGQLAHAAIYGIRGELPPMDFCNAWWWVARSAEALNGNRELTIHWYLVNTLDEKVLQYVATGRTA
jgi:hypothetical protein